MAPVCEPQCYYYPSDTESCHSGQPSESLLRTGSDSATVIKIWPVWHYVILLEATREDSTGLGAEHRPVPAR